MTSQQHQQWINEGSPWHLAVPLRELQDAIIEVLDPPRDTLGTIGDTAHLDAEPPEDHTPYSETGWPEPTPHLIVTALDYQGPGWEALFEHMINTRHAGGFPWIKYINFRGIHHSWEPNYEAHPSSDWTGHGHLSIRSDWCFTSTGLTAEQLIGVAGPTPIPVPTADPVQEKIMSVWQTISAGASGQHVMDAQGLLNAHGASLILDGLFGPKTTAATQHFQVERHVANSVRADGTGDGQIGPQTLLALLDIG